MVFAAVHSAGCRNPLLSSAADRGGTLILSILSIKSNGNVVTGAEDPMFYFQYQKKQCPAPTLGWETLKDGAESVRAGAGEEEP